MDSLGLLHIGRVIPPNEKAAVFTAASTSLTKNYFSVISSL